MLTIPANARLFLCQVPMNMRKSFEGLASVVEQMFPGDLLSGALFIAVVREHGLAQEYITPYTPEQNGMIERFFRTIKEECIWQYRFKNRDEALHDNSSLDG